MVKNTLLCTRLRLMRGILLYLRNFVAGIFVAASSKKPERGNVRRNGWQTFRKRESMKYLSIGLILSRMGKIQAQQIIPG